MNPVASAESVFNKQAKAYEEKFMYLDLYNDTYDALCDLLHDTASVLDVGCGPGNISRYLFSKRPGLQVHGIDIASNMVDLARANNPSGCFGVMDCREISTLGRTYDAIVCGFCLPYLSQPETESFLTSATNLLQPGGLLYLSVIEGDRNYSRSQASADGQHTTMIHYYSESFLSSLLEPQAMKPVFVQRKEYRDKSESSSHLILTFKKP